MKKRDAKRGFAGRFVQKMAVVLLVGVFMTSVPQMNPVGVAEAHSGRTDSGGGHKDNKNKSGLGSYHYHCGGYSAHLHENGVCPYQSTQPAKAETQNAETRAAEIVPETQPKQENYGWQKDEKGWWFLNEDSTYPKTAWKEIDKKWYYFGDDGYMLVDTVTPDGLKVDKNGALIP